MLPSIGRMIYIKEKLIRNQKFILAASNWKNNISSVIFFICLSPLRHRGYAIVINNYKNISDRKIASYPFSTLKSKASLKIENTLKESVASTLGIFILHTLNQVLQRFSICFSRFFVLCFFCQQTVKRLKSKACLFLRTYSSR